MCLSMNRYEQPRVTFTDTILLGLEVRNGDGPIEHVIGYFNKVGNGSRSTPVDADLMPRGVPLGRAAASERDYFGWEITPPQGNAMLIAVPAKPGTLTPECLVPVGKHPNFMKDYKKAIAPRPKSLTRAAFLGAPMGGASDAIVVKDFDGGTYDVVIANNARSIAQVIGQVDEGKRPLLNEELYAELDIVYPGFSFLLFCFAEKDADQAGCALVKYQPTPLILEKRLLFLPGLDGHNGRIERGAVKLNHTLIVGSYQASGTGSQVEFTDRELVMHRPYFLLDRVVGKIIPADMSAPQGDFLFLMDDVRKGTFCAKRELPPGWSKLPGAPARSQEPFYIR